MWKARKKVRNRHGVFVCGSAPASDLPPALPPGLGAGGGGQHQQPANSAPETAAATAGESVAATCCVCWERAATHLFAPCGHQCVCMRCGEHVMDASGPLKCCVVCRASVAMLVQVFVG